MISSGLLLQCVKERLQKQPSLSLKVLDLVAYVLESPFQVIKVSNTPSNKSYHTSNRHLSFPVNYGSRNHWNLTNRIQFPFLSKRYENTSFYGRAQTEYADCFSDNDFEDWLTNSDWCKQNIPFSVIISECLLLKKEVGKSNA